jgi:formylglycine-generating enzyme required for sulfatase activity
MRERSVIPSPGRQLAIQAPWTVASMRALLCMLCMCLLATPAWAQKRMALVIGNGDYVHESRLNNPVNDARLIARTLRGLGFSVDERFNLGQRDMVLAINRFTRESSGADTALVYFAGHGMQPVEGGRNFLLPVDANIHHDDALDSDAVPADRIVEQMERAARPARLRLVVLDACRNNRQASRARSGVRGLARMEPGDDYTLIAFSTNDQSVALDGQGAHSPYAEALSRHLSRARELPVRRIFELTASDVRQATGQQQRPRTYGDLDSRVGLDGVVMADGVSIASAPALPPVPAASSVNLADLESQAQVQQQWVAWQQRMQADFDRVEGFQGGASLRVEAWRRFLGAWAADNPTGSDDERLRAQAQQRLASAERESQQQRLASASAAVLTGRPTGAALASPEQTFKDCAECPEMVVIPAGRFLMGSPGFEPGRYKDEGPQRWVDVPRFAMGKFEVTQGQWQAVMGSNPSYFEDCGLNCPVESVSWNDAQEFVRRLNQRTGQNYRLPSEAEWEYAARAGTTTSYSWGDRFDGNRANNSSRTVQVGNYPANAFGLHDMHGNVLEWVQDVWQASYVGAPGDGSARTSGGDLSQRLLRGGSWNNYSPLSLRSAIRFRNSQDSRSNGTGLRIAKPF